MKKEAVLDHLPIDEIPVVCWRFAELMARARVTGKDLSGLLKVGSSTISGWRTADVVPGIGGDRIGQIIWAINKLAAPGTLQTPITIDELIYTRERSLYK